MWSVSLRTCSTSSHHTSCMKYLVYLIALIVAPVLFFLVGKQSSRPQELEREYLMRRASTQFPESEEFEFPGLPATLHIPNGFSLSNGSMRLLPTESVHAPACLEYMASILPSQTFFFFTLASSSSACLAETSYPHASNIHIQQPFAKICDNPRYRACTAFSPDGKWQAIHAFTRIPEFSDPANAPGSLASFYAFYNPEQKTGYDTIVISLSSQYGSIHPDEFEAKVAELATELSNDHPLYTFQQDMQTLDTLVDQIIFDEVGQ